MKSDTIAAIATPAGKGGVAIIRISGARAHEVVRELFSHTGTMEMRKMYYGNITDNGAVLDQCLAVLFPEGGSFTGEAIAEIHCHGGFAAAQDILQAVLRLDVRLAERGEFTRRAFLNGRLDLSQAEAIGELIDAESRSASRAAAHLLAGELGARIHTFQDDIKNLLATIEVGIDYPDEMEEDLTRSQTKEKLTALLGELNKLLESHKRGKITKAGLMVCLAGPPNAGKSSLLNVLCGFDRAIVTPIAGTTRDVLHEVIDMNGLAVHLYDTAGLRDSHDIIEQAGVDRSFSQIEASDVVLYLLDASAPIEEKRQEQLVALQGKTGAILLNKSDLPARLFAEELQKITPWSVFSVSTLTGEGLDQVYAFLKEQAAANDTASSLAVTSERHYEALLQGKNSLENALTACKNMPMDCVSIDLSEAWTALGEITGETVSEDIIDHIFAKFCVGK